MPLPELSEREKKVLEAVIQCYVETAQPAGSRALARKFGLGVSPATIRNTMSDLEDKGFLYHPHTSAGRIPTDAAYRSYVNSLLPPISVATPDHLKLAAVISGGGSAIDQILLRAAQSLGVITQELGVALGPRLDRSILRRLDLVRLSSDRLLMVLTLDGGTMRTIFVETRGEIADVALAEVSRVLNERLTDLTMAQVRETLAARLRDATTRPEASELLNVFIEEADQLLESALPIDEDSVVLGQASVLAEQPEFASGDGMRRLVTLTETRQQLGKLLRTRSGVPGISITIGSEHDDPSLESFTVVTAEYTAGALSGVIGVIGPTRMSYEKVISLVSHTSRLVTDLLDENG
ncbi:MAG: heat-inducible transcriptional repressor HrcA [Gemmatimonadaceae bacterium]|jgi:heat-inducible transcriptional repressor